MLDFIFGSAKTGKTTYIYDEIKMLCQKGQQNVYYFVPEQFALEAEKSLFSYLGSKLFLNVTVTSFSRISGELFKSYGRLAGNYLNDCSKLIIMSKAIEQVKDGFSVYKKSSKYSTFSKTMLDTIEELKNAGISSDILNEKINGIDDEYLKLKLSEISSLYMVYEALLGGSGIDRSNDIERGCELLKGNAFFANSIIFIDEFKGFTGIELLMLKYMLIQAERVCVSLCFDKERASVYKNSPFSSIEKTYMSLLKTARQVSVSVKAPTSLEKSHFNSAMLSHLEQNLYTARLAPFEGENNSVFAISCKNEYDEADFVLATIKKLVHEQGLSFNDIAIIARDETPYTSVLHAACKKYDVAFYDDAVDNVIHKPLIRFLSAALSCAVNGLKAENVLNLLKCKMTEFSIDRIAELENYLFVWDIAPKHWKTEFVGNPEGFRAEISDENKEKLSRINEIRNFVFGAISKFKEQTEGCTGKEMCAVVATLLQNLSVRKINQSIAEDFLEKEDFEQAGDYIRVWEILMEILDLMAVALGDTPIEAARFLELFMLCAKTYDMGTVPQAIDAVLIGNAERVRTANKKAIFVIGTNEDVFPFLPKQTGVFTDKERRALCELEIELSPPLLDKINEERFIAYKTFTSPTDFLFVTSRKADISGTAMTASPLVYQLISIFGEGVLKDSTDFSEEYYCATKSAAFSRLAPIAFEDTEFCVTLKNTLKQDEFYKAKLERLETIRQDKDFEMSDKAVATALFGKDMYISPTRVDGFYRCAFAYFCEHGLRVLPLKKAELDPMETGTLIHMVLELVLSQLDLEDDFDDGEVMSLIGDVLSGYISEVMGGEQTKTKRFLYLYNRIRTSLFDLIKRLHEELSKSDFSPCGFECEISETSDITPLKLFGNEGQTINVAGKIDRIDSYTNQKGEKYIRIVDYKSGKKEFRLDEVLYGLNLQMLIYLHCIEKNGKGRFANSIPAGILYMPAGQKQGSLERDAEEKTIKKAIQKAYRMNGLLLNDKEVVRAMEQPCDGIFIPVSENKDGAFSARSASALISLENLGKVNSHIEKLVIQMSDELLRGKIPASPFDKSCDYCQYSNVCGKKDNAKKREYIKLDSNEDIVKVMENGFEGIDVIKAKGEADEDAN